MQAETYLLETFRQSVMQLGESESKEKGILLLDKFEDAESISEVIAQLKKVKGCIHLALFCEWIIAKSKSNPEINNVMSEDLNKFKEILLNAISFNENSTEIKPKALRLVDLIDRNLLTGFQRFSDIVTHLANKNPQERKTTFGVLAMISRSSLDVAKKQKNILVEEFFEAVILFIINVDKLGTVNDSRVSEVMKTVGDELNIALTSDVDPKESFAKVIKILKEPIGNSPSERK